MILFLCAQDLSFFWLGLLEDNQFKVLERKEAVPDQYLFFLDAFLKNHQMDFFHLNGLSIVVGPGSFTASRVSLTIANSIHFTHQIQLLTLENPGHLSPDVLIKTKGIGTLSQRGTYAHPFYDRPPNITAKRGDNCLNIVQKS